MRNVLEGVRNCSRRLHLLCSHKPRPSAAPAATKAQEPWRFPSPTTSFSTLSTGQATTAISTRNPNPRATSVTASETTLEIDWDDGHDSSYHQAWLRVNCPSFLDEGGHRTVFPGDVKNVVPMLSISEVGVSVTWRSIFIWGQTQPAKEEVKDVCSCVPTSICTRENSLML